MGPFTFQPDGQDWLRILPELAILGTALLVLLVDLALPQPRKSWLAMASLAGIIAALVAAVMLVVTGDHLAAFDNMVYSDKTALLADMIILFSAGAGLLFSPGYIERQGITQQGEYYALMLLATLGMMFMASAANLMIIFAGLEVLSLSLYILSAFIVSRSRSQEAGMKYFILSSFASGFLLYGMALTYGATGATSLQGIESFLAGHRIIATSGFGPLLIAALGLLAVGFCFKVAAIPFQAWTPDVYVGAPTSVTAFMSVGTKVAAFVAMARVFVVALHAAQPQWTPILWAVAVLTMVGGNVLAVTQSNVKRMLAYSSIANAGYILVAIVTGTQTALAAMLVYLISYAVMNTGAFGVVLALERDDGTGTMLKDFSGLARRRRGLAAAMAVFLFSLAGIPPLVGFAAKYYVFYAAIVGGHLELAIIGVLASLIGMFYYLRVIWLMYFVEPQPDANLPTRVAAPSLPVPAVAAALHPGGVAVAEQPVGASIAVATGAASTVTPTSSAPRIVTPGTWFALAISLVLTVVLGIIPGSIFTLATQAASALFH
ncbi:MAG: NADH-quinone oxidoreductase subunit N [Ktedonobacterales bacterium]